MVMAVRVMPHLNHQRKSQSDDHQDLNLQRGKVSIYVSQSVQAQGSVSVFCIVKTGDENVNKTSNVFYYDDYYYYSMALSKFLLTVDAPASTILKDGPARQLPETAYDNKTKKLSIKILRI